jgi:hypothetical protein
VASKVALRLGEPQAEQQEPFLVDADAEPARHLERLAEGTHDEQRAARARQPERGRCRLGLNHFSGQMPNSL